MDLAHLLPTTGQMLVLQMTSERISKHFKSTHTTPARACTHVVHPECSTAHATLAVHEPHPRSHIYQQLQTRPTHSQLLPSAASAAALHAAAADAAAPVQQLLLPVVAHTIE